MTKLFTPLFSPKNKSAKSIADLSPPKPVMNSQPSQTAKPLTKLSGNLGALALLANPNVKKLLIILGILILLAVVYYWLQDKPKKKKKDTIEDQIRSYKKLLKKK